MTQIDRLLALSERATQGPWSVGKPHPSHQKGNPVTPIYAPQDESDPSGMGMGQWLIAWLFKHSTDQVLDNAAFIVAMENFIRNDLPALRAKIAELEGERDEARDVIREVIRAAGGVAHPECSMDFLKLAPAEVAAMKSLLAERDAASARVGELEEALEPFAKAGSLFDNEPEDPRYHVVIYNPAAGDEYKITDRHLRRARLARGEG